MNLYLTTMTSFYILGALLAIALALVVIAAKKSGSVAIFHLSRFTV
jgi:hypothetical protein